MRIRYFFGVPFGLAKLRLRLVRGNKKKHTLYLAVAHQEVTTAPLGLEIDWQRQDKLIWK